MIINRILINNLTIFSGKHELNLLPSKNGRQWKPIIIIGGMNGSGKTTFFDAIKLCLYGQDIIPRLTPSKYSEYIREKIHTPKDTVFQPNFASVEIDFEYSKLGDKTLYHIERAWQLNGRKVNEYLAVKKNDQIVNDVEKGSWQEFIKELIPFGLSQLFFFDGEKIQRMMSDEDNVELKKSIMSLFGLDLIERLQADLKIYKINTLKKQADDGFKRELYAHNKELNIVDAEIRKIGDELSSLENGIQRLSNEISQYTSKLKAQGAGYLDNRDLLEQKKTSLEEKLESIKDNLRELTTGLLPIAIAKDQAESLKRQLLNEDRIRKEIIIADVLKNKCQDMLKTIDQGNLFKKLHVISPELIDQLKQWLKQEINSLFYAPIEVKMAEVHGLSEKQTANILQKLDEAVQIVPLRLKQLVEEYEITFQQLHEVYTQLQKIPDEEEVRPMHEKLAEMNKELGGLLNEKKRYNEAINERTNKRNELRRKIEGITNKLEQANKAENRLLLIKRSEAMLSEYFKQLSKFKIAKLEHEFANIFNRLHRKTDQINRIVINHDSFDVFLFDKYQTKINKNNLSSGELEIYAMSMVWALAKISGQKLPFVIDTPLARLDSDHRDNLINVFFPYASHQMIIFSTDTEVDRKYFNMLRPYLARCYNLEYDKAERKTSIKEGYFWV